MSEDHIAARLREQLERHTKQTATATILGATTPDDAAESLRVGSQIGVPAQAVLGRPQVFKSQAEIEAATAHLSDAPKTQAWLRDRMNAALAKDDLENATAWERSMAWRREAYGGQTPKEIGQRIASGAARMVENVLRRPGQKEAATARGVQESAPDRATEAQRQVARFEEILERGLSDDLQSPMSEQERALYEQRLAEARQAAQRWTYVAEHGPDGFDTRQVASENAARAVSDWVAENIGEVDQNDHFTAQLAEGLGSMLPLFLASLVPGVGLPAAMKMGADAAAVEAYDRAIANGASETDAEGAATIAGLLGTTEALPLFAFLNRLPKPVRSGVLGAVGRIAIDGAKGAVEEGVQEGGMAIAQNLIERFTSNPDRVLLDEDVSRETLIGAVLGAVFGGGVSLVKESAVEGREMQADMAGTTAARLEELSRLASESKIRDRSPERFRQMLEAQGFEDNPLYVPADEVRALFQAKDVAFEDAAMAWGLDPDDVRALADAGGDVMIPESVYATRIAGTPDEAWVQENAVSDPEGEMSVAEAARVREMVEETTARMIDEAQQARVEQDSIAEQESEIEVGLYEQARNAGLAPDAARNSVMPLVKFFSTMAERAGVSPRELAARYGLIIDGLGSERVRRRGQVDAMLNTLRRDPEAAERTAGGTLLEFIIASGGVRDTGGDVESMDVPRGVIAETADQVRERMSQPTLGGMPSEGRGMGLDVLGRRAIEEGFFPGADDSEAAARLLDAIQREVSGEAIYRVGQGPDADLQALSDELARRGINPAQMSNDEIMAALEGGQTLFQPGKRGAIQIPSAGPETGNSIIQLFEGHDLSTLLHESGHFFLEVMADMAAAPDAPQQIREDVAAIREWLGNDGGPITTEQHEKWARGIEAYFMEGQAPSLALMDAFGRFRAWLTRIYRSIKNLNVKVSPQVREAMDRMLATDQEIAEARAINESGPLFQKAPPGMSEVDWETYQRIAKRSEEDAAARLLKKTMAKIRREKLAWYRDEKKAVRAQVEADVNARPEYRLVELLANQRWIGGDDGADIPDMRLDRQALIDQFGVGILEEISRARLGGKRAIYTKDGASPGQVAEFFGFDTIAAMVEALQNAGKRERVITSEVERIMLKRHGDPMNDGTIEEEALAAIHNDQQARQHVAEARHLARQVGRDPRTMKARIYRQRARLMIGRMPVREAMMPAKFLAAERRAARAAQDAFARVLRDGGKPDLAKALQAKEQQILNGFLYNESKKVEAEVRKGRERMRQYGKASVREKLEGGYIEQIDQILADYDFRQRGPGQVARTESLRAYIDRMIQDGREAELSIDDRLMDEAHRKHYTKLSVDELRGLFDTIANIDHMGRFKQKLIEAKRKRDLARSAETVAERIREAYGTGKAKQESAIRSTFNLLWTTDTILVEMDGGDEMGAAYDEIKSSLDVGQAEEQRMSAELAERLHDVFSVYTGKDLKEMAKERHIPGGNGHQWSKLEIIAAALNTGNADNMQRLLADDAHASRRLTSAQLDALLNTLDKRDWDFVQSMWDLINSYWPQVSEVTERRTGVKPKKVEAQPVVTKHGVYRGGYYPIQYDPGLSLNASMDERSVFDVFVSAGRHGKAQTANGHTQARKKTGNGRTLNLDMSVAFSHMRDVIRDITLSEAVDSSYRILNHPTVVDAYIDAGRMNDHRVMNLWLKDLAKGPIYNTDIVNTLARIVKNNFTLSRLAFNMKTVILQATGVAQSAVVVGKRNMVRGLLEYRKRPLALATEVMEKSPFMAERQSTFQKDIYDFANDVRLSSPLASRWTKGKNLVAQAGFAPIVKMQFYVVDLPTWLAGYRAGLDRFGDEARAIQYADRLVARSQDSGLMGDRNAIGRGTLSETTRQSDFIRMFTTLAGYMMVKMNRGKLAIDQGVRGVRQAETPAQAGAAALNAATDLTMLYVVEALMMALLYDLISGEDEVEGEDYAEFLMRETASAVFGGVPFVRDGVSAFSGYGAGGVYGSVLEVPARVTTQVMQGENDKALRRAIGDVIGIATGLPTTAGLRVIEGVVNSNEVSPAEALFGANPLTR